MDDTYGLSGVNFINMLLRVLMLWPFTYISPTILNTTFPVHLTKSYALIYALLSKPCASKMSVKLLAQKLLVTRWWNPPLFSRSEDIMKRCRALKFEFTTKYTVKLGYHDPRYNEFTAIMNKNYKYFWSHLATLLHESSRL